MDNWCYCRVFQRRDLSNESRAYKSSMLEINNKSLVRDSLSLFDVFNEAFGKDLAGLEVQGI